jgi:hypothetical protein
VTIASTFSEDDETRYVQAAVKQSDGKLVMGTQVPRLSEGDDLVSRQIREFEQSVPPNPGIDRVAQEIEWLQTKKTKPQLSALCDKVGITDVAHHRAWLAKEYIAARNTQSSQYSSVDPNSDPVKEALRLAKLPISLLQQWCREANLSIVSLEPARLAESLVLHTMPQQDSYGFVQESTREETEAVHEDVGFQAIPANPTEEILNNIELAESKQDLQRIYAEVTEDNKHPERWPAEATKAGLDRMRVIENMRPVGADSPFA